MTALVGTSLLYVLVRMCTGERSLDDGLESLIAQFAEFSVTEKPTEEGPDVVVEAEAWKLIAGISEASLLPA